MRLYLSSFRTGNLPHKLVELAGAKVAGANVKALVIANACDLLPETERRPRVERELRALESLGFSPEELDLRRHFPAGPDRGGLGAALAATGLVWARGGNAFVLRRAMRQSGFDAMLVDALSRDAFVYGGYSGGIAVLAPSLHGIDRISDPGAVPAGYAADLPWQGLDMIPYVLAPHYRSSHSASAGMERVVDYYADQGIPFRTLRDGQVLIVSGDREELAE